MSFNSNRDIVESSFETFVDEVVLLVKDGWLPVEGSADSSPFGGMFTVSMYRDESSVQALKTTVESMASEPKMTRAESLQKARDSRKGGKLDVTKITEDN